jgi:hypothetical protein
VIAEKEFLSPGMDAVPTPPRTSPGTPPPVLVRQGGGPFSAGRSHRRRRSASPLPPPPVPAEMPEDTTGRIAYITVSPPPDLRPDAPAEAVPEAARSAVGTGPALEGWLAVALAAAVILVIFLVGMVVTR